MSWLGAESSVYLAPWQSGNRRQQWRTGLQPCLGEPATDQSCWGSFQEPKVIRLNEGVGEHVRTKISPQLKQ
jgi:hypothetical protein